MNFTKRKSFPGNPSIPLTEVSDEGLIDAIGDGAVWALEQLYQRYRILLYSLIYRMVNDHPVAEDLLQEAFLSVWQHARSYSPQAGAVRSWLFSIVHHRTIDYLRSVRRRASHLQEVQWEELGQDEHGTLPDIWQEVWHAVQSAQVRQALMQIPIEQRMVIELAYFQGWTHTEIAEGCHLPLGTVKTRIRSGLLHLKQVLEAMGLTER
jgi:RNA polymerase sigma factor (sigma-70 family)